MSRHHTKPSPRSRTYYWRVASPVTQADVAAHAGVSRALVSLVLQDSPKVSPERRDAVLSSMRELGYRPNAAARHLGRRTRTLGVMVEDLHNPFFAEVIDGVQSAASERGLRVLINTGMRNPSVELSAVEAFLEFRVDGIILIAPLLDDERVVDAGRVTPTVLVGRTVESEFVDSVHTDEIEGAYLATRHLIELGHRYILHVDTFEGAQSSSSRGRRQGYVQAMSDFGLSDLAQSVFDDSPRGELMYGLRDVPMPDGWLVKGHCPTALFGYNDLVALGAYQRVSARFPEVELAVVGYDNTALAALGRVPMTSVDQPRKLMGEEAVAMIVERADGRTVARTRVFEPRLEVRSTSVHA